MARGNIGCSSSGESDSDDDEKPSYEELAKTIHLKVALNKENKLVNLKACTLIQRKK
jgi:hypothetical protein